MLNITIWPRFYLIGILKVKSNSWEIEWGVQWQFLATVGRIQADGWNNKFARLQDVNGWKLHSWKGAKWRLCSQLDTEYKVSKIKPLKHNLLKDI